MIYRNLGRAGVKVSPLCLGAMNFGSPTDEKDSIEIIDAAYDAGINFIDTANVYNNGVSEEIVGKAIRNKRDQIVLATKLHGSMGNGPNDKGNSRYHIVRQAEASLRRLQTDRIDLYQLHRPDPSTPMEEQLAALTHLVRSGKVLYIGTSTFPAWQLCEAGWIAERFMFESFVCEQPPYSIFVRGIEKEVLPFCGKYEVAVIPWSPLAGGWLTGKYRKGAAAPSGSRFERKGLDMESPQSVARLEAVDKLMPLAEQAGATLSQFSIAWALANPVVTSPIIGPRTMDHLHDNLGSLNIELSQDVISKVDEIVSPGTGI